MPRLALISDTHMHHERLVMPEVDLLVHSGDFTRHGTREETERFLRWLASVPGTAKILTAGNHDSWAERSPDTMRKMAEDHGATYLVDQEIEVAGLRVFGSPITPSFRNMAYNRARGAAIRAHWNKIPAGLDVLVTHGPPWGVGDRTFFGLHAGCRDLLEAVRQRPPRLHVFGHIHEAAGESSVPEVPTRFLNVATRKLISGVRQPIVVDLALPV